MQHDATDLTAISEVTRTFKYVHVQTNNQSRCKTQTNPVEDSRTISALLSTASVSGTQQGRVVETHVEHLVKSSAVKNEIINKHHN